MQKETREQAWKERLQAQRDSGLTIRAWCTREDVAESRFHYWSKRLAPVPATGFIALPAAPRAAEAALELRTPEGYVIRLASPGQVEWLGGVLAALR
ncbi:MAG: IS66 family insertion sequence element accessory protein TnpA [Telluria sp.]